MGPTLPFLICLQKYHDQDTVLLIVLCLIVLELLRNKLTYILIPNQSLSPKTEDPIHRDAIENRRAIPCDWTNHIASCIEFENIGFLSTYDPCMTLSINVHNYMENQKYRTYRRSTQYGFIPKPREIVDKGSTRAFRWFLAARQGAMRNASCSDRHAIAETRMGCAPA
ncbi:hypothetical protein N7494_006484 [Penicillium frequentans]|uniref:Uncharacterized protein n=1 Tax=Penicillium frequentans TaxID=3151616 RepID=A0AAD6CYR4_9EURO|nr:hypothetical protein N7494_006484 [Penicillium glabrum]